MATVRPFRAHRPPPDLAGHVASPPYDVVTTARRVRSPPGNADSFLRVSRPEIDLPDGTDEHDGRGLREGRRRTWELVSRGALRRTPRPASTSTRRRWASTAGSVWSRVRRSRVDLNLIKKHEKTRPDKEDDRTRHIDEFAAHDEPVFLTYQADPKIDAAVAKAMNGSPVYDFTPRPTASSTSFGSWVARARASIEELFESVPTLYVADGHHRSAAASRVHKNLKGDGGDHAAFLAVVFPHNQMQILPYNRVVRDLEGRSAEALLERLRKSGCRSNRGKSGERRASDIAAHLRHFSFGHVVPRARFGRHVRRERSHRVARLLALPDQILGPIFGVTDPRRSTHVDFVGGIRGLAELEKRVNSGAFTMAIALYPTQIEQLFSVSDKGLLMPPKSTWFEPKLRSGLFVHPF